MYVFVNSRCVLYQGGNKLGEGESEHDLISSLDELCKEHDRETARQAIQTMLTLAK